MTSNKGRVSTFLSWRINLRWAAGGHELLSALKSGSFEHPWWLSSDQFRNSKQDGPRNEEVQRFSPTELNYVLVPRRLASGDSNSRTWICNSCGKLNFCGWMGGQSCSSSICKVSCSLIVGHVLSTDRQLFLLELVSRMTSTISVIHDSS